MTGAILASVLSAAAAADTPLPEPAKLPVRADPPDPLTFLDGRPVKTRGQWEAERRPELRRLFQHYMYGFFPPAPDKVRGDVLWTDPAALGGKATLRQVAVHFGPAGVPPIQLLLIIPNARKGPAPAFVGINFYGNHMVLPDPAIRLPESWVPPRSPGAVNNRATEAGRGAQTDVWNAELIIDRGYALATFYSGDIDPDRPDFEEGIHKHYLKPGQTAAGPHDWATVAAWAWGLSRAADYLLTVPEIDGKRLITVGHSRLGKTALLAAAMDDRFAAAIPSQAGCGGTAPSRGKVGESVKRINTSFPHWFNATFKEFNDAPERLPFDQHCLAALMAPRPVLFSNAVEDAWADPDGQFEMLKAADPVYKFLGLPGLESPTKPEIGKLSNGRLAYFIRPGKHSMTRIDWEAFLDFADRHVAKRSE
jgi:dienelactone hydrolase